MRATAPLSPDRSRIVIVSDTWHPQMNGVVREVSTIAAELERLGASVTVLGPDRFRTVFMPRYPEVRFSVLPRRRLERLIDHQAPDALHIMTEGSLGLAARALARDRGWAFTTSFTTRLPEFARISYRVPKRLTYAYVRRFHAASAGVMVSTETLREELRRYGFRNIRPLTLGVDSSLFRPGPRGVWDSLERPVFLYVGRVSMEKNLPAFLDLDLPGSKVVVGDGPELSRLRRRFPSVHFAGFRRGPDLVAAYASADVFVMPSRTETFGLVLLEALACGTPIAAFPVTGPIDIVALGGPSIGAVDADLRQAALRALNGDRTACRRFAECNSWQATAQSFLRNLVPMRRGVVLREPRTALELV